MSEWWEEAPVATEPAEDAWWQEASIAVEKTGDDQEAAGSPIVISFPHQPQERASEPGHHPVTEKIAGRSQGRESVRIEPELLDQLVNNAGEVSIYRARIEQQNISLNFNLGELDQTIMRLRDQLRQLDIETETQIIARHQKEPSKDREHFDPLEMDQYSSIQQLSRALSETVNDLSNLGQTIEILTKDTDSLLLQQSRVTNDLQSGLMHTRMLPFTGPSKRLERVVRQTAQASGKSAVLQVTGSDAEMDRSILNRMMGPLEHLLRNAVAHGVEPPERRRELGKPEKSRINLSLERDGGDIVLQVWDDGAGMDGAAIRKKAIERGLMNADADLQDKDLYQFILEPGFSTAKQVDQIAGRGVGMDVVLSEVKQLGGTISIDSELGQGSRFTIRLPFTLAISENLLVTAGDEIYAVPHTSVEGVIRISRRELEMGLPGQIIHDEMTYESQYLGELLTGASDQLPNGPKWFYFLLVHAGGHHTAVRVDSLLGNRQIVVKSVGLQLSTVRWVTGGTILADGQVALILDMGGLVRTADAHRVMGLDMTEPMLREDVKKVKTIMVVDDSITVRKVTTRLLERNEMHVITAKDGVDALAAMQDTKPDLLLLDIEMPRMDGFELARHMRRSEELNHLPIIMITSRTGSKHRKQAIELGVRGYMGKPYKEDELLEGIQTVLAGESLV